MAELEGDSPEAVAWQLLLIIARAEGVDLDKEKGGWSKDQILAAYRECLATVCGEAQEPAPLRHVSQGKRNLR